MHVSIGRFCCGSAALLALATPLSTRLAAQDTGGPPKVLVIQREYLKPGKGGMMHERSESAFIKAFSTGAPNMNYFAMDSQSGVSRSLFFISYDSLAAWQKDNDALSANKTKAAAVDHAMVMDGDLLTSYDQTVLALRPDLSLGQGNIKGAHYFEITTFVVKPGHRAEFSELEKIYADAYRKVNPETAWDTFEVVYGSVQPGVPAGTTFVVMNPMKSLADADKGWADGDKVVAGMGKAGMARAEALEAACVEMEVTNLFALNPRMSNPPKLFLDWDPEFWKVAAASSPRKVMVKTEAPAQ